MSRNTNQHRRRVLFTAAHRALKAVECELLQEDPDHELIEACHELCRMVLEAIPGTNATVALKRVLTIQRVRLDMLDAPGMGPDLATFKRGLRIIKGGKQNG